MWLPPVTSTGRGGHRLRPWLLSAVRHRGAEKKTWKGESWDHLRHRSAIGEHALVPCPACICTCLASHTRTAVFVRAPAPVETAYPAVRDQTSCGSRVGGTRLLVRSSDSCVLSRDHGYSSRFVPCFEAMPYTTHIHRIVMRDASESNS